MWYRSIFLPVALFATLSLSAQQFSLGIQAGYSLSNAQYNGAKADFLPDLESVNGFHTGLESRWHIDDRAAMLLEIQYSQKGYSTLVPTLNGLAKTRFNLNYVALPVAGSFRIWKGLSLQGGVEAEWLLKSTSVLSGSTSNPQKVVDLYNNFDLGLLAGIEYEFNKSFFISARHIFGLTPFADFAISDENGESVGKLNAYHQNTEISLGYRHYFGK